MAYSAPINFTAIEAALVSWLRTSTGISVMWSSQNRPQVAKPFLVLKMVAGPTIIGRDTQRHRMVTVEDVPTLYTDIVGARSLTYNVQAFTNSDKPGENAQHYLSIAQAALGHDDVIDLFVAAKIGLTRADSIVDLDSISGAGFESRASLDLVISTVSALVPSVDAPTNWIETVELVDASEG